MRFAPLLMLLSFSFPALGQQPGPNDEKPPEQPAEALASEPAPKEAAECSVATLCLTRADLTLLISARALAEEGMMRLAQKRYQQLLSEHPASPFAAIATQELALLKTAPMQTGPMRLRADQMPRRSGTFTGILIGGGLGAAATFSIWALGGEVEEPAVISAVLVGAGGAWAANRQLKAQPETLGVMDMTLLGAVWAPIATGINLGVNNIDLGDATGVTLVGSSFAGAGAGYLIGRHLDLHAGAATLAWSGAVLGAVEMGLLQVSLFPDGDNEKVFMALNTLGSVAGLIGGALWGQNRRFSSGRGRIMTMGAYGAAGLTAATLSMIGADDTRVMAATAAASFPLGAWIAYLFTEEVEKTEPRSVLRSSNSLAWALDQEHAH